MLRWIVSSSLKFRFIIVAAACAMMFFGAQQLKDIPVDVFPEFAPPRVEIQTPWPGMTAEEIEALVTIPIEQSLQGLDNLDVMRSKSVPQLSSIELIFEPGTDLLQARQLVQERVAAVTPTLPNWASPPFMIQPLSATSRVMKIGMTSQDKSVIDLSMISYWTIRTRLLQVPGVANVAIWGERIQMPQVQVEPQRLAANGITLNQVMETTADALDVGLFQYSEGSVVGTGGFIDTPNQRFNIQHTLPIKTPADLAQVTLQKPAPSPDEPPPPPVKLGDVTTVVEGTWPLMGDAVINDGPGLMLIIEKFPWANTLDVTQGVEEAINLMQPGLPGIEIDTTIFRPASFVEASIDNLTRALLLGSLLVILVLIFFLFEWRTALISIIAIPLSLMAAGLVLMVRGDTLNTMVLAGLVIAVGVVVDDAIIDIENIWRRLRQNHAKKRGGLSIATVILNAVLEVRRPIIYATLIILLAVMPVFFLEGLSGSFFRPLTLSYALAVFASLFVALTVTPALSLILLKKAPLERRDPRPVRALKRGYERVLKRLVSSPRPAYLTVTFMVITGLAVTPLLGQSLLPDFKERDFLMHWVTPPGTSHPETVRITQAASRELRAIPGVRNFGAHIGQASQSDEVVGINFGENWISVDPKVDYDKTLSKIQEVVNGYPGLYRDVQTYLKERIREVLTGSSEAVVMRIYGDDLNVLRTKAEEVLHAIEGVEGVIEPHVDLQVDIPQLTVQVDLARAQQYGVKPGDVRRAAATLVSGEEAGDIFRDGKTYDVHVWSTPTTRVSPTSIRELLIDTPSGQKVRLQDVANVEIKPTPNVITRSNSSRYIDVGANVQGRPLSAVVADIERKVANVDFPKATHLEFLGEFKERTAAQNQMMTLALLAATGIFLLLWASFRSLRLAVLAFATLPLALVGGLLVAHFTGGIISLGSLVGFFTVFGIAARNGILMINHYQHLEEEEGMKFGPDLVIRGAIERLSPILMTALATGLALVPLAVTGNLPGHEIEHPMAVVILGGLTTSTLLNLLIVPLLYLRFGRRLKAAPSRT